MTEKEHAAVVNAIRYIFIGCVSDDFSDDIYRRFWERYNEEVERTFYE